MIAGGHLTWKPRTFVPREQFITDRCVNRSVLHLGCIGLTEGTLKDRVAYFVGPRSLHSRIQRGAGKVLGVDLDAKAVEVLRSKGRHDLIVGNVESLEESIDSHATFDLILAGDIIEHVSNPGLMLQSVRRFLSDDGELLITTPNAFGLPNHIRYLVGRFWEGRDHVHSYSFLTLQNLLERHAFHIQESYSCFQEETAQRMKETKIGKATFALGKWLFTKWPKLAGTILVIAKRNGT